MLGRFLASFGCVMAVFISFTAARVVFWVLFGLLGRFFEVLTADRVTFVAFIPAIYSYLRCFYGLKGVFCDPRLVFILLVWLFVLRFRRFFLLVWLFVLRFRGFSCLGDFGEVISALWADFAGLATRFPCFCPLFCFYARIFRLCTRVRRWFIWFLRAFACTAVAYGGVLRARLLLSIYSLFRVFRKCQKMAKYGNIAAVGC